MVSFFLKVLRVKTDDSPSLQIPDKGTSLSFEEQILKKNGKRKAHGGMMKNVFQRNCDNKVKGASQRLPHSSQQGTVLTKAEPVHVAGIGARGKGL